MVYDTKGQADILEAHFNSLLSLYKVKNQEYANSNELSGRILDLCLLHFNGANERGKELKVLVNIIDKLARIFTHMEQFGIIHLDSLDDIIVYLGILKMIDEDRRSDSG